MMGPGLAIRDCQTDDEAKSRHPGWPSGWSAMAMVARAGPPLAIRMANQLARHPDGHPDGELDGERHPDGGLDGELHLAIRR